MQVKVTHNTSKNGIEVRFSEKPEEFHRDWLKARRFRYSRSQNLWYMRYSVALSRDVCAYFQTKQEVFDGSATGELPAIPGMEHEATGVEAAS